jgi:hypothetical protein
MYTNIFHSEFFEKYTKLDILVWNYTIRQHVPTRYSYGDMYLYILGNIMQQ